MGRILKSSALVFLFFAVSGESTAQDTTYKNPVDGKTYVSPSGWVTYSPESRTLEANKKIRILNIRLLQGDDEMAARTTAEDLAVFIKSANEVAIQVFSSYDGQAVLMTQFTCQPDKCEAKISSSGNPPHELLQSYDKKLGELPPAKVCGQVKFLVTTGINS